MKYLLSILFLSTNLYAGNWGHRASGGSGEYHNFLPENSLIALEAGLLGWQGEYPIQDHEKYTYLEFDVQETRDGELVVFHDKTISRMIPYSGENKEVFNEFFRDKEFRKRFKKGKVKYKKLKIYDFTLMELQRLRLAGKFDQRVPTLDEFLEGASRFNLRKPIIVEIKHLHTNEAKRNLLYIVRDFRDSHMDNTNIKIERDFNFP